MEIPCFATMWSCKLIQLLGSSLLAPPSVSKLVGSIWGDHFSNKNDHESLKPFMNAHIRNRTLWTEADIVGGNRCMTLGTVHVLQDVRVLVIGSLATKKISLYSVQTRAGSFPASYSVSIARPCPRDKAAGCFKLNHLPPSNYEV